MSSLSDLAEAFAAFDAPQVEQERAERVNAMVDYAAADMARGEHEILSLEEQLQRRAEGKPWYVGTGHDDAILPHQWAGIRFGFGAKRFLLGDGMGLGKTRQTIGWLDLVQARRVLVICQAEICAQFAGELSELAPHRVVVDVAKLKPPTRHGLLNKVIVGDGVIVVNYELFRRDKLAMKKLLEWHADAIIVDEAHNLKGYKGSANYKYVEQLIKADNICGRCGGHINGLRDEAKKKLPCAHCGWTDGMARATTSVYPLERYLATKSIKHVALTTGTPILNTPADLFPMLHLLDPLQYPTLSGFTEAFCQMNYASGKLEFRKGGLEMLQPMIRNRYLARQLEDAGVTLPEQHRHVVRVELDAKRYPDQARVVRQISEQAKIELESGSVNIMSMMALITRKRQANVWPAGIEIKNEFGDVVLRVGDEVQESAKFDALCEEIERQHKLGRRQVVFSQFKTALAALELRLTADGYRVARFDGDTQQADRDAIKEDFYRPQGEPRFDIVLVNYRSGGTGLNLTRATVTHILDEEWNPGKRDQAYARTHRMGQTEETDVYVYRMGGVDTWMSNLIRTKERIIKHFDEATDHTLADELRAGILADA